MQLRPEDRDFNETAAVQGGVMTHHVLLVRASGMTPSNAEQGDRWETDVIRIQL